ncbi:MAG: BamA/TamA family outer membrane protein [Alphaproteobacteria bacterium]|nr:BamA/TamA family outer membrane protein [Alphaproteobacteria bacterium]
MAAAPPSFAADPQPYTVAIAKTGNAALDRALTDSSRLIELREKAPVGPFALTERAREDGGRFVTALNSFGYYKGGVDISIAGHALDDPALADLLARLPASPPAEVAIAVRLGPLFHIGAITVEGSLPPEARGSLGLALGAPAAASDVLTAQTRLLDSLRSRGYALAQVSRPKAIEDPNADTLDLTYEVKAGPRVEFGAISITGLHDVNEAFVRKRLLIYPGEQFSPEAVEKARADLAATGVFSSVRAVPADKLDAEGRLPIAFEVIERDRHTVAVGGAYSTDLGAILNSTWSDRNLFGNAEQLNLSAGVQAGGSAVVRPGYNASAQFIKPDFLDRDQSLQFDLGAVKQSLIAYDQKAVSFDALLKRKLSEHWSGSIGISGEEERIAQEGVTRSYTLAALPFTVKYDSTNNLFDPREGIRAGLALTPTEALGHNSATFMLTQLSAATYLDLSSLWDEEGRSIIALRGLAGDAVGGSQFGLPPDQRFYAGGSATVRGYKYQTLGPLFPDDKPAGGTSILTGTVELRQRVLQDYGFAIFVDGGEVSAGSAGFGGRFGIGAGFGLRYFTPIGPIRLDIAVPLIKEPESGTFQIYIGIGQAF